jgi:DNA-binding MarR family transcriptional regulator
MARDQRKKAIASSARKPDVADLRTQARHLENQLNLIQRKVRQQFNAEVAQGQLTGPHRLVMAELVGTEGLSVKDLSRKVNLAHSTVSGIADRLIRQGLMERRTHPTDRRVSLLVPSRAVRDFLTKRMPELTLHPLVEALQRATVSQREEIVRSVDRLAGLLTITAGEGL